MSSFLDVAGTEEEKRKEKTPKESGILQTGSWAYGKEPYDCHQSRNCRQGRREFGSLEVVD
ncbi:MAG: hypothetical protein K2P30_03565 [Lachnospiraceae bacterium]|nr:hypothetical protein [Lachnospiraceae bacterium]MDE6962687.1 hypothetical protein [Lachnospiraceae bacterium]